jgi:hypothetical protein
MSLDCNIILVTTKKHRLTHATSTAFGLNLKLVLVFRRFQLRLFCYRSGGKLNNGLNLVPQTVCKGNVSSNFKEPTKSKGKILKAQTNMNTEKNYIEINKHFW